MSAWTDYLEGGDFYGPEGQGFTPTSTGSVVRDAISAGQESAAAATATLAGSLGAVGALFSTATNPLIDVAVAPLIPGAPTVSTATSYNVPDSFVYTPVDITFAPVESIALDDTPTFEVPEWLSSPVFPNKPVPFTKNAPVATALLDRSLPEKPTYVLPDAPTMQTLVLPPAPELLSITFTGVLPAELIAPPEVEFNFSEVEYESVLTTDLKNRLRDMVLNSRQTGLTPAIEQQLWDQSRERTRSAARGTIDQINRQFARSGWLLPQGDQIERIFQAQEILAEADITESRSIATAQAELEQKNMQFAITQGLALEGQLMTLHNQMTQRAFDAQKFLLESAIAMYQAHIAMFNAGVALYTAQAQVYRDRIQAELAKIEVYKAELEGQKLLGDINTQGVANYTARIQAVVAIFGLYKDELEAVKILLQGDELKLKQFEAGVRVYSEELRAKSLEYEGYKTEIAGEDLKIKALAGLADVFGKRVQAFTGVTDSKLKKMEADIKINYEVPLQVMNTNVAVYKAEVEAQAAVLQARSEKYKSEVTMFAATSQADVSRFKAQVDQAVGMGANAVGLSRAASERAVAMTNIQVTSMTAAAQVQAQITAAYASQINISTSESNSTSSSSQTSGSISNSEIHTYSEK